MNRIRAFLNTPRSTGLAPERVAERRGTRGLVFSLVALGVFAVLFALVKRNRTATTDAAITLRLQRRHHPWFDRLMRIVSWPGFPPQSRILPPGIAAALWFRGMRLEAIFQLAAWGTGGISSIFKRIMRRQRPHGENTGIKVAVANIGGSSFPSGHVIIYTGVYGFLAFLSHTWIRSDAIRRTVVGLLTGMVSLVGTSRVYLGHHWFTDTVASYLLGTTYLVGLTALYRRVKRWTLNGG